MPADPIIFGKLITWYAIFSLIGVLVVGYLATRRAIKFNLEPDKVVDTLLISSIGVIIGGSLLYGFTRFNYLASIPEVSSVSELLLLLVTTFGGSVFYGGLYGGLITGCIYITRTKQSLSGYCSAVVPLIAFFHFFGRIGCFMSGCCYGVECRVGITYEHSLYPPSNGMQRIPVQAIEAVLNLLIFFLLMKISENEKARKHILSIYLASYSTIRFLLEFIRGDEIRGVYYGLSTSQYIALVTLLVIGCKITYTLIRRNR